MSNAVSGTDLPHNAASGQDNPPANFAVEVLDRSGQRQFEALLTEEGLSVGRAPAGTPNHLSLAGTDIARYHLRIEQSNGQVRVYDVSGKGDAQVGNVPLPPFGELPWAWGTLLRVGPYLLQLKRALPSQQHPAAATTAPSAIALKLDSGREIVDLIPGQVTALGITVTNQSNQAETLALTLAEPEPAGWTKIRPGEVTLEPGESSQFTLTITVPRTAAYEAREYPVTFRAANTTSSAVGEVAVRWIVAAFAETRLEIAPPKRNTEPQQAATYSVVVQNLGNTRTDYHLKAGYDEPNLNCRLAKPTVTLDPGQEETIGLTVRSQGLPAEANQTYTFSVQSETTLGQSQIATAQLTEVVRQRRRGWMLPVAVGVLFLLLLLIPGILLFPRDDSSAPRDLAEDDPQTSVADSSNPNTSDDQSAAGTAAIETLTAARLTAEAAPTAAALAAEQTMRAGEGATMQAVLGAAERERELATAAAAQSGAAAARGTTEAIAASAPGPAQTAARVAQDTVAQMLQAMTARAGDDQAERTAKTQEAEVDRQVSAQVASTAGSQASSAAVTASRQTAETRASQTAAVETSYATATQVAGTATANAGETKTAQTKESSVALNQTASSRLATEVAQTAAAGTAQSLQTAAAAATQNTQFTSTAATQSANATNTVATQNAQTAIAAATQNAQATAAVATQNAQTAIAVATQNAQATAAVATQSAQTATAMVTQASDVWIATSLGRVVAGQTVEVEVQVLDGYGRLTISNLPVTLSLKDNTNVQLNGPTRASTINGIATFRVAINQAGTYTLTAKSGSLSDDSSSFTVVAASAVKLVITRSPDRPTGAGQPLKLIAEARDQFDNLDTGFNGTVELSFAPGANPTRTELQGTLAKPALSGVATFGTSGEASIQAVGTGYVLRVTGSNLQHDDSDTFNIVSVQATKLAFTVSPGTTSAGRALNITVEAQNDAGVIDTDFNGLVTLSFAPNGNPGASLGAQLEGIVAKRAENGSVTFGASGEAYIRIAKQGYRLRASSGPLQTGDSAAFDISGNRLVITTSPSGPTRAGQPLTIIVQAQDDAGNRDETFYGTVTVDFALNGNPTGTTLHGTRVRAANRGQVEFTNLNIKRAGTYRLRASGGGLEAGESATFSITASKLVIATEPASSITAGNPLGIQIEAHDEEDKLDPNFNGTIEIEKVSGSGALKGTVSRTAVGGVVKFDQSGDATFEKPGDYKVKATSPDGLKESAATREFTIVVGVATKLEFISQPGNTLVGAPITLTVRAYDKFGNPTSNVPGSPNIRTDPNITLENKPSVTFANGVFEVNYTNNMHINTPGTYILKITSGSLVAESSPFEITVPTPTPTPTETPTPTPTETPTPTPTETPIP